jgi:hypothetical protein
MKNAIVYQNFILNDLKSNRNEYIKYIVTEKQTNLIELISEIIVDINSDIEDENENFTLISIDEIVKGSFERQNVYKIFEQNGCENPSDFSAFESFEYYYEELKRINSFVVSKYNQLKYLHAVLEYIIVSRNNKYKGTSFEEIIETTHSSSIETAYLSNGAKSVACFNSFWDLTNTLYEIKNAV